ncbi:MAG: DEAD/DEAH box helicase [Mariniphaga sp.]|nr:DEAD/DEAH box helicase [Mariniphaga sp.]
MNLEFIVALVDHRYLGKVFIPYLVKDSGAFKTIVKQVLSSELEKYDYSFSEDESVLVKITEKYSDENLARRFSKFVNVSEFYGSLKTEFFKKQITPYIDKHLHECVQQLIKSKTHLFRKEAKYANLYDADEIRLNKTFSEAIFYFNRLEYETQYLLKIFQGGEELKIINRKIEIVAQEPCILNYNSNLLVFRELNAKRLIPFFSKEYVSVPSSIEDKYYSNFVLNTIKEYKVSVSGFTIINDEAQPSAVLSLEKNLNNEPVFALRFYYGDEEVLPNSSKLVSVTYTKNNGQIVFKRSERNKKWESEIISYLNKNGLNDNNGFFLPIGFELLRNKNAIFNLVNWINTNTNILSKKGIEIKQRLLERKYYTGTQDLKVKLVGVSDWFDIYAVVRFGDYEIPFIKLKKYILNDIREFELPNGETAVLPEEWFSDYKGILPFSNSNGDRIQLSKHHFPIIKKTIKEFDKDLIRKLEQLDGLGDGKVDIPATLKAKLRPYQVEGFSWLYQLHINGFGGCLADDMGLGKTLQALALLLKLKRLKSKIIIHDFENNKVQPKLFKDSEDEGFQPASIIVLPTSLVHNWENEIYKFAPSLKVSKYIGSQRKKSINLNEAIKFYDVILTTYGTVRNDIDILSEIEFFYVIADESQYIKNPTSKIYKSIVKLKCRYRLVLTGTPIENSLLDLWSQINFLNNGMLGNQAYFKRFFVTPIEKKNDKDVHEKLQLMIRPFILRRKKEEVASDLPPLMEQTRYCNMEKKQRKIYEKKKSEIRNSILENIEVQGIEKSSIVVLQGLTKLRQLANHPSMLDFQKSDSGKFNEIFRSLENLMAEKHKVLIFSSFVKHLELLKEKIESKGWEYSVLTGKTTNREKVINEFQKNENNRIFLISLKAGGVGLNLVEADYVFIIDPWWNPASEIQAISRAHRIGQDKNVFVFRFITEDSIEQKIQQLQMKKTSLAEKFINSNNPFREITKEELENLLK